MSADPTRISVTAKLAAWYRQFSDLPFASEVATGIGAREAFDRIVREHGLDRGKLDFYAPMFEARYKSITELVRKSGATQVLELACGYSLRGLDLSRGGRVRYVETDLAEVIETKRAVLDDLRQRHGIERSPSHVVTVANALDLEQVRAAAADLEHREPLLVLCEGLVLYLTRQETQRLAANVRRLLDDFAGGTWLTPDFTLAAHAPELPPERVRLREAITGITQRQLDAAAFADADELERFLRDFGFDVAVHRQVDETPAFASIDALGLSTELIERLRPVLCVWSMTPRTSASG